MKNYLVTLWLLLAVMFLKAQDQLVIELKTDNYPDETAWALYSVNDDLVQEQTTFNKNSIHFDTININATNCYYFRVYDAHGDGVSGTNSGYFKIYLNNALFFESSSPDFGDSLSVYNLGEGCVSNDAKANDITMHRFLSRDSAEVCFEVLNMGAEEMKSLSASYSYGNYTSTAFQFDVNIPKSGRQVLCFPTKHSFSTPGTDTLSVQIIDVNGTTDANVANNEVKKEMVVLEGYLRHNVIEDFGGYECAPCWQIKKNIEEALTGFEKETQTVINFMSMSYSDKKYFPEIDPFLSKFGNNAIPQLRVNGIVTDGWSFSAESYSPHIGHSTPVKIFSQGEVIGDSLRIQATISTLEDIQEKLIVRLIPMEDSCIDVAINNPNNEHWFTHVAYELVNGVNGIPLPELLAQEPYEFDTTLFVGKYPLEEGTLEDLSIGVYLQSKETFEVYQTYIGNVVKKPFSQFFITNISAGQTEVDTAGLVLEVKWNYLLFDEYTEEPNDLKKHFELYKNDKFGQAVPINVYTNEKQRWFTVSPQYGWDLKSDYYLRITEFVNLDGSEIEDEWLKFTTISVSGTKDFNQEYVQIYPNPASQILNMNLSGAASIEIFNSDGKRCKGFELSKGAHIIDLSDLKSGSYFVQISNAEYFKVEKLIILNN